MTERPGGQRTVDDVGGHPAERDAGEAGRPWLGRVTAAVRAAAHRPAVPEPHVMTVGELASARGLAAAAAHGTGAERAAVDLVKRARVTTASDPGLPVAGPAGDGGSADRRAPDRPATDPAAAEPASVRQPSAEPEADGSRSVRSGGDRLPTPVSRTAGTRPADTGARGVASTEDGGRPAPANRVSAAEPDAPAVNNPAGPLPGDGDVADRRAPDGPAAAGPAPVRQSPAEPEAVRPGGDRLPPSASGTATSRRPDPVASGVEPADRGGQPEPVDRAFPADHVRPRQPFQRPAGPPRPPNRFSVPARPPVVDEYAILGLTRRSRGRVGSRLFTLFFVFIYGVIALQLIAVLLGPSP